MTPIVELHSPLRNNSCPPHLLLVAVLSILVFGSLFSPAHSYAAGPAEDTGIPVFGYEIVKTYPHDVSAFTQGLFIRDGILYEGTGLSGRSSLSDKARFTGNELVEPDDLLLSGEDRSATDGKRI